MGTMDSVNKIGESKNFTCRTCGKCYTRNSGLKQHERYFCQNKSAQFKCPFPQCLFQAKLRGDLNRHIRISVKKKYKCEVCGKQYAGRSGIHQHKKYYCQNKEATFMCTYENCCFKRLNK
ncbi:putative zinc finger protein 876 [Aethina tumida]|uniref:putative zinc finger protein 876 n=1 Tax=Aethina tumida TaxID=116153 RepID=UPI002148AA5E|nr:putative zinc finger protein 876 [Aethina tumida]